jgi:hypothetical protein
MRLNDDKVDFHSPWRFISRSYWYSRREKRSPGAGIENPTDNRWSVLLGCLMALV